MSCCDARWGVHRWRGSGRQPRTPYGFVSTPFRSSGVPMRTLLATVVGSVAALLLPGPGHTAEVDRPNVVFILADDLGVAEVGCYGQKLIRTPNIDRLAANGLRFTRFYTGNAVCAPSRCCLMTGKHP